MLFHVNKFRVLFDGALIASMIFLPWYVPLIIAICMSLRWRAWEIVIAGLVLDLLWLPGSVALQWHAVPYATIGAIFILAIFEPIRRKLLLGPMIR